MPENPVIACDNNRVGTTTKGSNPSKRKIGVNKPYPIPKELSKNPPMNPKIIAMKNIVTSNSWINNIIAFASPLLISIIQSFSFVFIMILYYSFKTNKEIMYSNSKKKEKMEKIRNLY